MLYALLCSAAAICKTAWHPITAPTAATGASIHMLPLILSFGLMMLDDVYLSALLFVSLFTLRIQDTLKSVTSYKM